MRHCYSLGALALAAFALAPSAQAGDSPAEGFQLGSLPYPAQSAFQTLSNGDVVTFDGTHVERYDASGALLQTLGSFSPPVYQGLFAVDPSESFALVGKTGEVGDPLFTPFGEIYKVDLSGGGMGLLADILFNYDAVFESPSSCLVSGVGPFATETGVYRLDTDSGGFTLLVDLQGPSGPIALDGLGNLYYATQDWIFPSPPGAIDVLFFPAELLDGSTVLDEFSAVLYGSGFDDGSDLVYDDAAGALYMSVNLTSPITYGAQDNRIYRVGATPGSSEVVVEGAFGNRIVELELDQAGALAPLLPFQPSQGQRLRYGTHDSWASASTGFYDRAELTPARPQVALSGPGAGGVGPLEFALTGAPAGGTWVLLFGLQANFSSAEQMYVQGSHAPVFSGLDPLGFGFVPYLLPLDGEGQGGFSLESDGSLVGQLALQALCFDGALAVGTSNAVLW